MNKLGALVVIFSTIIVSSCSVISFDNDAEYEVTSGHSFGFCLGPCTQTLNLNWQSRQAEFVIRYSEFQDNSVSFREEVIPTTFSDQVWDEMLEEVKSVDDFNSFEEVYGCPDCADGGAEWIEIIDRSGTHRVTFEFGGNVKGLDNLILLFRNKRMALSEQHVSQ